MEDEQIIEVEEVAEKSSEVVEESVEVEAEKLPEAGEVTE